MCDHDDREAAMVTVMVGTDGTPTVWCDPCIAPIVWALNAEGIPTVASCCGHGHRPGRITLADGREIVLPRDQDDVDVIEGQFPFDINGERFEPNS